METVDSVTTSDDGDDGERVDRYNRGSNGLRERLGRVRYSPALRRHQRCCVWEHSAKKMGIPTSGHEVKHRILFSMERLHFARVVVLGRSKRKPVDGNECRKSRCLYFRIN